MNPLSVFWRSEIPVFHVRMGGCGGCGEVVDSLMRDRRRGAPHLTECNSPRHARLVVVSGCHREPLAEPAASVISQAPPGCPLVLVGDCTAACDPVSLALGRTESMVGLLSPDLEVPGCPAEPGAIAEGFASVTG